MKSHTKIVLFIFLAATLFYGSCQKFENYPIEPVITYNNYLLEYNTQTGITERGVLIINYTDGDGDLGLRPRDTFPPYNYGSPYYYNMIIDYYEMRHGEWELVPLIFPDPVTGEDDTLTFSVRIPELLPLGGNQPISGFIQDTMFIYNPLSDFDTIKFSVYLIDRALNKSNVIFTPPIVRSSGF